MESAEQSIRKEFSLPQTKRNKYILLSFIFITMSVGFLPFEFIICITAFILFAVKSDIAMIICFLIFTIPTNFAGFLLVYRIFREKPDYILTSVMALIVPSVCTLLAIITWAVKTPQQQKKSSENAILQRVP